MLKPILKTFKAVPNLLGMTNCVLRTGRENFQQIFGQEVVYSACERKERTRKRLQDDLYLLKNKINISQICRQQAFRGFVSITGLGW